MMKIRSAVTLLPFLGLSLTGCGWDKSLNPPTTLVGYFQKCAASTERTEVERQTCSGYVQALSEVRERPLFVAEAFPSTVPADAKAFAMTHILRAKGDEPYLVDGTYQSVDGKMHTVTCDFGSACTIDGKINVFQLGPLSQIITDGSVYIGAFRGNHL